MKSPADHIPVVLERVKKEYVQKHYGLADWKDDHDFMDQLARKMGKLLKAEEGLILYMFV